MPVIHSNTNSKKVSKHVKHEEAAGIRIAPGPFIGIVKNNIDSMRSGRLQVFIPELGGNEDDTTTWRTLTYCTPFYGVTSKKVRSTGQDFAGSPHSYGMWFVPPDVGVQVLCIFVNGDPFRGYWFACVPEWPNLHMVPGISNASWHGGSTEPVVEYNPQYPADYATDNTFFSRAQTPHDYQSKVWQKQGLVSDSIRGPGTSSAFRESPSRVFGISTPGPELAVPAGNDPANGANYANLNVPGRQGGHQFIMDDGDAQGNNQMIRLRTSNGNMLLMHDTAGIVYLINSTGSAWFEMDGAGNVRIFSQGKIEMHGTGGITFETPGPLNLTGSSVDISATGPLKMSGSTADLSGKGGVKVGGSGGLDLSGSKVHITAQDCMGIMASKHIDLKGACITFNTTQPQKAAAPSPATPGQGPTHEPYGGHQNTKTNSPATSPSYGATNGVPSGAAGNYGASASFGLTASIPNYYGTATNANGPIKFNPGFQGSYAGQAVNQGNLPNLNVYDSSSVNYVDFTLHLPVSTSGFAVDVTSGQNLTSTDLSPGEAQNNPGDLSVLSNDPFAIGQNNGLNVYSTPVDGIAALTLLLDIIQSEGAQTVQDFVKAWVDQRGTVNDSKTPILGSVLNQS
jgi:hypothetical protein